MPKQQTNTNRLVLKIEGRQECTGEKVRSGEHKGKESRDDRAKTPEQFENNGLTTNSREGQSK